MFTLLPSKEATSTAKAAIGLRPSREYARPTTLRARTATETAAAPTSTTSRRAATGQYISEDGAIRWRIELLGMVIMLRECGVNLSVRARRLRDHTINRRARTLFP